MATNFRTHLLQEQSAKSSHDGSRGMKRKAEPNGGEAVSKKKLRIGQAQGCGSIHNRRKDKCVALEQQYQVTCMKRRPLEVAGQEGYAAPGQLSTKWGQNWTPIRGQVWMPIDTVWGR